MYSNQRMFLLLMPSDEPFHSPASFNMISVVGIHFALVVARSGKPLVSFTVVKNYILLTDHA